MEFAAQASRMAEAATRGYLSSKEILAWADAWILELSDPPHWLFEISLSKEEPIKTADLFRPHTAQLDFEQRARVTAVAFVCGRLTLQKAFEDLERLWVESMRDPGYFEFIPRRGPPSKFPDSLEDLFVEYDQRIDEGLLPEDFLERFRVAACGLVSEDSAFPFQFA